MKTKWDKILQKHPELYAKIQLYNSYADSIMEFHNKMIAPLLRQENALREELPMSTTRERNTLEKHIDDIMNKIEMLQKQLDPNRRESVNIRKEINDYICQHFTTKERKIALRYGWYVAKENIEQEDI